MDFDIVTSCTLLLFFQMLIFWVVGLLADKLGGYFDFILKRQQDVLKKELVEQSNRRYDEEMFSARIEHYVENEERLKKKTFDPSNQLGAVQHKWQREDEIAEKLSNINTPGLTEFKRFCLGVKIHWWCVKKIISITIKPIIFFIYIQKIFGVPGVLFFCLVIMMHFVLTLFWGWVFSVFSSIVIILFLAWHFFWDYRVTRGCIHSGIYSLAPNTKNKKVPGLIFFRFLKKEFVVRAYGVSLEQFNQRQVKNRLSTLLLYGHRVIDVQPTKWASIFVIVCAKALPEKIRFSEDIIKKAPETVSLYSGFDGRSHSWIALENGHVMLVGVSGSGKSTAARSQLTCFLCCYGKKMDITMVDFKAGLEAGAFKDFVLDVISKIETAIVLIDKIYEEMTKRLDTLKEAQEKISFKVKDAISYREIANDPGAMRTCLIIFDEFGDMVDELNNFEKKKKGQKYPPTMQKLISIARRGRAAAFHLMILTQRPDIGVINGALKAQLDIKYSGRMASNVDSITALGTGEAFHIPAKIKGRFIAKYGEARDVQFPDLSLEQSLKLINKYARRLEKLDVKENKKTNKATTPLESGVNKDKKSNLKTKDPYPNNKKQDEDKKSESDQTWGNEW